MATGQPIIHSFFVSPQSGIEGIVCSLEQGMAYHEADCLHWSGALCSRNSWVRLKPLSSRVSAVIDDCIHGGCELKQEIREAGLGHCDHSLLSFLCSSLVLCLSCIWYLQAPHSACCLFFPPPSFAPKCLLSTD